MQKSLNEIARAAYIGFSLTNGYRNPDVVLSLQIALVENRGASRAIEILKSGPVEFLMNAGHNDVLIKIAIDLGIDTDNRTVSDIRIDVLERVIEKPWSELSEWEANPWISAARLAANY